MTNPVYESAQGTINTPYDRMSDCYCRGGTWVQEQELDSHGTLLNTEYGVCTPNFPPSGKHYSTLEKGCTPNIPGQRLPDVNDTKRTPAKDFYARNKYWFWGILAVGVIGYLYYTRDKKPKKTEDTGNKDAK